LTFSRLHAFLLMTPLAFLTISPASANPVESTVSSVAVVHAGLGTGTGFLISKREVLTAAHVVRNASTVRLAFAQPTQTVVARVTKRWAGADLAVLEIDSLDRPVLDFRVDSAKLGDPVLVVGAPGGELSVTRGIVSAERTIDSRRFVQTDAAVNPGNSGGPMTDEAGAVVGVIQTKNTSEEGTAFALDARDVEATLASAPDAVASPTRHPTSPRPEALWLVVPAIGGIALWANRKRPEVRLGKILKQGDTSWQ
jgi:S1-C subfamily serine protease